MRLKKSVNESSPIFFYIYEKELFSMKHVKIFEEYYDDKGNTYEEWEDTDHLGNDVKITYLNPELESVLPELKDIKEQLMELNTRLEYVAPADEDIFDAIEAIDRIFKKWEDRPLNKTANKYNL